MTVIAIAALVAALGMVMYGQILYSIIGVALLIGSTSELFFPQRYEITDKLVRCRSGLSNTELEWEAVKAVWSDEQGVKLSPLPHGARMESFRGVYLRFGNNREAVLAKIANHWNGKPIFLGKGAHGGGNAEVAERCSGEDRE